MSWLKWYDAEQDELVQSEVDASTVAGAERAGVHRQDISEEQHPGVRVVPRLRSDRWPPREEAGQNG